MLNLCTLSGVTTSLATNGKTMQGNAREGKASHKQDKSQERQGTRKARNKKGRQDKAGNTKQAKQGKIQPRQHVPSILSDCPTLLLPWYSLADLGWPGITYQKGHGQLRL